MQLFGLVNTMLANDRATAERDLSIARYAGERACVCACVLV
jgi:FKBP12-rapamycin complex-associated protein